MNLNLGLIALGKFLSKVYCLMFNVCLLCLIRNFIFENIIKNMFYYQCMSKIEKL
jgi:hypothetical protein